MKLIPPKLEVTVRWKLYVPIPPIFVLILVIHPCDGRTNDRRTGDDIARSMLSRVKILAGTIRPE